MARSNTACVDDEVKEFPELREEYWTLFAKALREFEDPVQATDPFHASLEVSSISYDALPLIGEAAMKAAGQAGTPQDPQGDISGVFDTEAFFRFRGDYRGRQMTVLGAESAADRVGREADRKGVAPGVARRDGRITACGLPSSGR